MLRSLVCVCRRRWTQLRLRLSNCSRNTAGMEPAHHHTHTLTHTHVLFASLSHALSFPSRKPMRPINLHYDIWGGLHGVRVGERAEFSWWFRCGVSTCVFAHTYRPPITHTDTHMHAYTRNHLALGPHTNTMTHILPLFSPSRSQQGSHWWQAQG